MLWTERVPGVTVRRLPLVIFIIAIALSLSDGLIKTNDWYVEHEARRAQVSLNFARGACSGTYVGHNTILTAEHCIEESETLNPSYQQVSFVPAQPLGVSINEGRLFFIKKVESDGSDHILLTVDAYSPVYLKIDQSNYFKKDQQVLAIGHPGGRSNPEIEHGTYIGAEILRDDEDMSPVSRWDMAGQPGDSGEGIIDHLGHIVAVLSLGSQQNILCSLPLNFTPAQIKGIK